nr:Uncharacterised protein [Enterobacter mori]
MKRVRIKAQVGYRSPRARKGEASIVSPNRLQRQFTYRKLKLSMPVNVVVKI